MMIIQKLSLFTYILLENYLQVILKFQKEENNGKTRICDVAVLEDGKEFVVFKATNHNGFDYVYLMSNFKPLEVKFAKQIPDGDGIKLEIVTDQAEKEELLNLFQV